MALKSPDRVQETCTGAGTGALVLAGSPPTNYRTLAGAGFANGDTFFGTVVHRTVAEWQSGQWLYNAGSITLQRFHASSTGAQVSFTAGTKDVTVGPLGRPASPIRRTADFNALPFDDNDVDTTDAAIEGMLPADPNEGDRFAFNDFAGTWGTNPFTVNPNGQEFVDAGDGSDPSEPMTCSDPAGFVVVFSRGKYRPRG